MKAEHRHELKTNELADWLGHFPQWFKENMTSILITVAVIVMAGSIYYWLKISKPKSLAQERYQLSTLVSQIPNQRKNIVDAANQGVDASLGLLQVAQNLGAFAQSTGNDQFAAIALIKQAEAIRMEYHYRFDEEISKEELSEKVSKAKSIYRNAAIKAGKNQTLQALIEFSLGLCEEELGNFVEAKEIYSRVVDSAQYEGTAAQAMAANRLKIMDEFKREIVFEKFQPPETTQGSIPPATGSLIPNYLPTDTSKLFDTIPAIPEVNSFIPDMNETEQEIEPLIPEANQILPILDTPVDTETN